MNTTDTPKTKHSPTPWTTEPDMDFGTCLIKDATGQIVALCRWGESYSDLEDRAAHIVHCVNAHDALVDALELALMSVEDDRYAKPKHLERIRAALALAKDTK